MKKKFKILIVDDCPEILLIMEKGFKFHGHQVNTATSGDEAIEILLNKGFDVIISDYQMPNGNGMELLSFVTTMNKPPIFYFLSGQADSSVEDCLKAGAKHFFPKPFELNNLISEVIKKSTNH